MSPLRIAYMDCSVATAARFRRVRQRHFGTSHKRRASAPVWKPFWSIRTWSLQEGGRTQEKFLASFSTLMKPDFSETPKALMRVTSSWSHK